MPKHSQTLTDKQVLWPFSRQYWQVNEHPPPRVELSTLTLMIMLLVLSQNCLMLLFLAHKRGILWLIPVWRELCTSDINWQVATLSQNGLMLSFLVFKRRVRLWQILVCGELSTSDIDGHVVTFVTKWLDVIVSSPQAKSTTLTDTSTCWDNWSSSRRSALWVTRFPHFAWQNSRNCLLYLNDWYFLTAGCLLEFNPYVLALSTCSPMDLSGRDSFPTVWSYVICPNINVSLWIPACLQPDSTTVQTRWFLTAL